MASNASISGLVSGMDTATIISQLMQIEAVPQTRLKTEVTTAQSEVKALQSLNTKAAALATKAAALAKSDTWAAVTATSSNTSISASTTTSAQPATFSVKVTSIALTHQLGFTNAAALTDHVTGATNTVMLDRLDGTAAVPITTDGTLQGLVTALNDPANNTGVHATAVKSSTGYQLLVESTATGQAQDFALTAGDGSALLGGAVVRAGTDASLDLGVGITATSTTNTFANLVPGVTLTLAPNTAVGATSTIDVRPNVSALSSSVSDLVNSLNGMLTELTSDTAYDPNTKTSGVLGGDALARSLQSGLQNTVFPDDGISMAGVGISTTRDGKLVFDATKFASAYAADPAGTMTRFTTATNGFAARIQKVAEAASDPLDGSIANAIKGRQTGITSMQASIADWDTRLTLRQDALNRQFTAMETALSQLNSQSNWLGGQISKLS